jgi:drug/metabolite transporter (DMT)-like permease
MAPLLSLLAATSIGTAAFLGGLASRRSRVLTVAFFSQAAGTSLYLVAFPWLNDGAFSFRAIAFGVMGGVLGVGGLALLYDALARGQMSVVAPVTAIQTAGLPVLFGVAVGERPSSIGFVGIACGLIAIGLLSIDPKALKSPHDRRPKKRYVVQALLAGSAFGAFFILIDSAGAPAGHWPLLASRLASIAALVVFALSRGSQLRPEPGARGKAGAAGCLDMGGNIFFLLAVHRGLLPVVTVVTSMYPLVTVVLARLLLDERLSPSQVMGVLFATGAVSLIALG